MRTGMLWFDDDPKRSLDDKVARAAQRFFEKYGLAPNLVYTNPRTADLPEPPVIGGVTIKHARSILPNHFWLGVAEAEKVKAA